MPLCRRGELGLRIPGRKTELYARARHNAEIEGSLGRSRGAIMITSGFMRTH